MEDSSNIKQKTQRGLLWNMLERIGVYAIQFSVTIYIARILDPHDFGLIAMLALFTQLSTIFIDSGFSRALIQKKDRTETDFSTIFFFNLAISILIYLILFFSAPIIAGYYEEPQLIPISRILFINFIISAINIVPMAKLSIAVDFKTRAIITTIATLFSYAAGFVMAISGCGVWTLVFLNISNTAMTTLLLIIKLRWKPALTFSKESFKQMFNYGWKLLMASIISAVSTKIYFMVIGKKFTTDDVGYYDKGERMPTFVSGSLMTVLQNVSFPIMSEMQNDDQRLNSYYRKLIRLCVFCVFPCMIGFALLAEPLTRYLLTEKWLPAVPLVQWFCISYLFMPLCSLNTNYLNAKGDSDMTLLIECIKLPIGLAILFASLQWGVLGIVVGRAINSFIGFFVNAYFPGRMSGYTPWKQLKEMVPTMLATACMAAAVWPIVHFLPNSYDIVKILSAPIVGGGVYYGVSLLLRIDEVKDMNGIVSTYLKKAFHKN